MRRIPKHFHQTLNMLRNEATLAGISFPKLLFQTGHFFLRTGLGPRYYVTAGMARGDFPKADKWLHISPSRYRKALDILNPPTYRKLTQNRLYEKALYNVMHIATVRMRGYYHPQRGTTDYGLPLKEEKQLDDLLGSLKDQTICLKPVEGPGGHSVKIGKVAIRQGKAVLESSGSDNVLDATALITSYRTPGASAEFIIEDRLHQSSQFTGFNPDSLNTLRLWVLCDASDRTSVLGGYLRVGRAGSVVDSASASGLLCPIDIETGQIGDCITRLSPHRDNFTTHPDHGAKLSEEVIEQWSELCDFACEALSRHPHTRFASLDIGVTPDGPVLMKTNPEPDKDDAAHANIPTIKLWEAAMALAK